MTASDSGENSCWEDDEGVHKDLKELGSKSDRFCDSISDALKAGASGASSTTGTAGGSVADPLSVDMLLDRVKKHNDVVEQDKGGKDKRHRSGKKKRKRKDRSLSPRS